MLPDSAFSTVVLPEPVPPDTTMLSCSRVDSSSKVDMAGCMVPVLGQLLHSEAALAEAANGYGGAVYGQWRPDDVDPGAVRKAGVAHRVKLVNVAADAFSHPLGDAGQVVGIRKFTSSLFRRPRRST